MSTIVVMDIGKTNAKLSVVDTAVDTAVDAAVDTAVEGAVDVTGDRTVDVTGTSAVKGVAGTLLSSETTQTRSIDSDPYLHLDTESVWHWYLEALARIQRSHTIDTIVVTAHGATAALIDDSGLVLPVMDYEFAGLDEFRDEYDERCDPFTSTYSPKLPLGLNLGRQLYWQRKRCPQQFANARYLLPYAQYWSWLLTGKAVAEVSTIGSHTDLWNPLEKRYSDFAMREGLADLFPPLSHAATELGGVKDEVRAVTGIDKRCRVLTGIHDSNASLLPWIHSRRSPFTVMSTGTWVIIFSAGSALQGIDPERDCTANVNIYSEPVACARFMGGREYAAIARATVDTRVVDNNAVDSDVDSRGKVTGDAAESAAAKDDTTAESDASDVAGLLTVIEHGVFALPAFAETGGPFPGSAGVIEADITLSPVQKHALASLYCALVSDESLTLCNSAGDIIVEGAFAKNDLLLQCLSVFRDMQNVYASADSTGTTMGAAMLASRHVAQGIASEVSPATAPGANSDSASISAPALTQIVVENPSLRQQLLDYRLCWRERVRQHTGQPPAAGVGDENANASAPTAPVSTSATTSTGQTA